MVTVKRLTDLASEGLYESAQIGTRQEPIKREVRRCRAARNDGAKTKRDGLMQDSTCKAVNTLSRMPHIPEGNRHGFKRESPRIGSMPESS